MNILKILNKCIAEDNLLNFISPSKLFDVCVVCEEGKPPELMTRTFSQRVCMDCKANLAYCKVCDTRRLTLNEDGICTICLQNACGVYDYHYKPNALFHRVYKNELVISEFGKKYRHYGVEIETDARPGRILTTDKLASLCKLISRGKTDYEKLLYVIYDSTCSFEFVSHPFTWKYFNKYGKDVFKNLFNVLKSDGFYSQNASDSGIHIHVSKASIKRTSIIKVLSLIYNKDNYDFILDVSQRDEDRLSNWASIDLDLGGIKNPLTYLARHSNDRGRIERVIERSTAINLTPSNTIEYRLFNGSLNLNTLTKNIQFVKSTLDWADSVSLEEAIEESQISYLKFLKKNQKSYYDLCFYLNKRRWFEFQKTADYFTRKHSTDLIHLKYNSDKGELS